ncbi:MAG: ABC transporter ATP-binding protein [Planctomycetales bacterium]|nr:ABC transporter ATP-binding protein [Planctomycetales bacterium]
MSDNVIEVRDLSRCFGSKSALDGASLQVPRGVVCGLVGENGAGKTTLIKHLTGQLRAQQGSVRVFGLDPVQTPVEVLGRIGYLSEDRDLPEWMTLPQLRRYYAAFFPRWDDAFASELQTQFALDDVTAVKKMSRGQRARAGLLVALAHRPELLVLDEPSSGLDPLVRRDILTAVIRTVADDGRTVLFSSHLLDEVERVADVVAIVQQGRVEVAGPLGDVLAAHRRLAVRFAVPRTDAPELPGALMWEGGGHEWSALCRGQLDALSAAISALGGEIVEEASPNLNEIFLAGSHR